MLLLQKVVDGDACIAGVTHFKHVSVVMIGVVGGAVSVVSGLELYISASRAGFACSSLNLRTASAPFCLHNHQITAAL